MMWRWKREQIQRDRVEAELWAEISWNESRVEPLSGVCCLKWIFPQVGFSLLYFHKRVHINSHTASVETETGAAFGPLHLHLHICSTSRLVGPFVFFLFLFVLFVGASPPHMWLLMGFKLRAITAANVKRVTLSFKAWSAQKQSLLLTLRAACKTDAWLRRCSPAKRRSIRSSPLDKAGHIRRGRRDHSGGRYSRRNVLTGRKGS